MNRAVTHLKCLSRLDITYGYEIQRVLLMVAENELYNSLRPAIDSVIYTGREHGLFRKQRVRQHGEDAPDSP
jgi:hypothetical protein